MKIPIESTRLLGAAPLVLLPILLGTGCQPQPYRYPVSVIPTQTPGVAYVIVRPDATARRAEVSTKSEYVLLCDGRPSDGMHCSVPPEASVDRISRTRSERPADKAVAKGVGTLPNLSVRVHKSGAGPVSVPTGAPAAAPASAATPNPAPAAPAAPEPEVAPEVAPATEGAQPASAPAAEAPAAAKGGQP